MARTNHWFRHTPRSWVTLTTVLMALVWMLSLFDSRGLSQEAKSQDVQWAEDALRWGRAEAGAYQITLRDDPEAVVKLIEKPVLRWSNSDAATVHGNVFLWVDRGRPVAIASIYKFFTTKQEFAAEFHSLATEPILAIKSERPVWQPEAAGIKLVDFPGAPLPASSPTQRLRQMREILGKFRAESFRWVDDEKSDLRPLPTPLYRYNAEDQKEVVDGAVFAFVIATDPEVVLVLEARRSGEKSVWQYGLARMSLGRLRVRLGEREIWSPDKLAYPVNDARKPYCLFDSLPLPDIPPQKADAK